MCWVPGSPGERGRRLVSSAVFQGSATWWRQEWRGNGELDQREGSGDPRAVPRAAEPLPEWVLLMGSLDLVEDTEIQAEVVPRVPPGFGAISAAAICPQHIAKPTFPGWNMGFQMCHLDFILKLKGLEPAFGPDKRNRGQDQIKDEIRVLPRTEQRGNGDGFQLIHSPVCPPFCHVIILMCSQHPTVGSSSAYWLPSPVPSSVTLYPWNVPPSL